MYLALRDLRHAKGRFALIGGVMALITLLVVMLTGLAAGLARESISAISTLPEHGVSQVAFSKPAAGQKVGFDSSRTDADDVSKARSQRGVTGAATLSMANTRATAAGQAVAVSTFAVPTGSFVAPAGVKDGSVVVGSGIAKDAKISAGDTLTMGSTKLRIARLSDDASYQHTPVVWMTEKDAKAANITPTSSMVVVHTGGGFDSGSFDRATGLESKTPSDSLSTISSYQAENGSLTLMRVMLMLVSALVVGAFFTVWTIQRTPDLAVLKAIGARTSYLVRDALGQAGLLLLIGGGLGTLVAAIAGMFARKVVPFVLNPTTTLVPLALLVILGLFGALVSLHRIVTVDPNSALGAAR